MKSLRGKYGALAKEQMAKDLTHLSELGSLPAADKYLPLLYDSKPATAFDYTAGRTLFVCEAVSIREGLRAAAFQAQEDIAALLGQGVLFAGCDRFCIDFVDLLARIEARPTVLLDSFNRSVPDIALGQLISVNAIQLSVWSGEYRFLKEDIESYLERGYCVVVFAGQARACAALRTDLDRDGIGAAYRLVSITNFDTVA